jgi:hypothetical protein
MKIFDEHKNLLASLGLSERDFACFDGKWVRYEFDEKRGVRIYDPYYKTSYDEYIGIDGWSAWSSEKDTFMSDVIRAAGGSLAGRNSPDGRPTAEEISEALRKKFSAAKSGESS